MSNNLDSTQMSENSKKTDNTQLSDTLEKTDDSDVSDDSNVSNLSSLSDNSLSSISTNSTQSDEDDEEDDDEDDEDEDEEDDDDEDDEDEDDEDEDEDDEDEEDEEDEEDKDKEDEDEFEDLSTESISSITSSCIKEEMKIYNKRIAALENKMDVNNTMLKQIDSKLNKLLNSKQLINNKKRKPLNDLNNLTRAPQIDEENNENNDENDINISSDQKDKNNKKRKIMRIYKNQIIVSEVDQMTYEKMLAENEKNNKINSLAYTSQIDDNSSNQPILNNILNNKWSNKILEKWGCCINNCINSTQRGFCQKGNGIVRINDNLAKYYITTIKNGINRSIKLITEKGFSPSTEFASLYYFEVKIIPEILEKSGWSSEIGLFCKNNSEQKSKYYCVCSNGLYYSNEVVKTSTMYKQMFGCLIKSNDIVGCGIYFPKLNQNNNQNLCVAQLFFTLNGEKRGKTISLEITNSENASSLFYPNVSLFCCSVEANFDGSTNKFLYNIDEFKIEE